MRIPTKLLGNYCVREIDLPCTCYGFVLFDPDDFASIYINARLTSAWKRRVFWHEVRHILNDDIHNGDSIRYIEKRAG